MPNFEHRRYAGYFVMLCAFFVLFAIEGKCQSSDQRRSAVAGANDTINFASNIRVLYEQILRSRESGNAETLALQCRAAWQKDSDNPKLKAIYAFSHMVGLSSFPYDTITPKQRRLRQQLVSYYNEAKRCREESLVAMPRSPEVNIMCVVYLWDEGRFKEALPLVERALQLAPQWSTTHYWLGRVLMGIQSRQPDVSQHRPYIMRALTSFRKAEALDPSIRKGNVVYEYVHAFTALGDYRKAAAYLDERIRVASTKRNPEPERSRLIAWKAQLLAKAAP